MAHICNKYKLGDIVIYNGDHYRVTSVRRTTASIPYTIWDYEYNLFLDRDPREGELSLIKGVNERLIARKVDDARKERLGYFPGYHRYDPKFYMPKFEYKKIIFSGPCTIILWKDGTKTIAKASGGDMFDPEKGVAICFMKRALGETEGKKVLRKANKDYYDDILAKAAARNEELMRATTFPLPKGVTFRPLSDLSILNNKAVVNIDQSTIDEVKKVEAGHKMDFRSCSTCKYASKPVTDKPCSNCASKSRYEKGYEK